MSDKATSLVLAVARVDSAASLLRMARDDLRIAGLSEAASSMWNVILEVERWNEKLELAVCKEQERREGRHEVVES